MRPHPEPCLDDLQERLCSWGPGLEHDGQDGEQDDLKKKFNRIFK